MFKYDEEVEKALLDGKIVPITKTINKEFRRVFYSRRKKELYKVTLDRGLSLRSGKLGTHWCTAEILSADDILHLFRVVPEQARGLDDYKNRVVNDLNAIAVSVIIAEKKRVAGT